VNFGMRWPGAGRELAIGGAKEAARAKDTTQPEPLHAELVTKMRAQLTQC
jgi:hypothetical protein